MVTTTEDQEAGGQGPLKGSASAETYALHRANRNNSKYFGIPLSMVLLLKMLLTITYPLNVSGDGASYFKMITRGWSNLLHAPGYPFLIGAPLLPPRLLVTGHAVMPLDHAAAKGSEGTADAPWRDEEPTRESGLARILVAYYVYAMNHAFDVTAIVCLYLVTRAIFSAGVGMLAVVLYGLNPWAQAWSTMSRPEQVQGDLLIISLYLVYRAHLESRPTLKQGWYVATATTFASCILVKFNALSFAMFLVVSLLCVRGTRRERVINALVTLGGGTALIAAFVTVYHLPATGTWRLSASQGVYYLWNFIPDLPRLVRPENGIASKTYYVLARVLPTEVPQCCENIFTHVDWVPEADRRPYRERYGALLQMQDRVLLDRLYEEIKTGSSEAASVMSFYYYLGLVDADRLLKRLYVETVRAHPLLYARTIVSNALTGFVVRYEPVVPLIHDTIVLDLRPEADLVVPANFGFVRLKNNAPTSRAISYKHTAFFWMPGVRIVSYLSKAFAAIPHFLIWVVIVIGVAVALRYPLADPAASRAGPFLLLCSIVLFFVASGVIIEARPKELRLVQPLLDVLTAVGCFHSSRILVSGYVRARDALTRAFGRRCNTL